LPSAFCIVTIFADRSPYCAQIACTMLSLFKGVSYHRGIRKWIAQTQHRSKKVYAAFETEDILQ
jgi:hypothetical protein